MTPTKAKASEVPETPVQSDEVRTKIVQNSSAGDNTAVGNERKRLKQIEDGEEFDGPGGSEIPIAGGEPKPDAAPFEAPEPIGAQAQPTLLTTNGTLPVNHVASPTGLVPVSTVAQDATQGAKLVQENLDTHERAVLKSGATKISRAKIESMTAGDLRAVAHDRGYDMGAEGTGTRSARRRFIIAQQADDDAADDGEELAGEGAASPEA